MTYEGESKSNQFIPRLIDLDGQSFMACVNICLELHTQSFLVFL